MTEDEIHRAFGRHSNIPDCCITFWLTDWNPGSTYANRLPHWGYVPCPTCLRTNKRARIRRCALECGKDCASLFWNQRENSNMTSELLLLGVLTLTSYQPIPAQTKPECKNRHQCETSIGDGISMYGCAVSQDLLKSGRVHYGDVLYVPGFGWRIVNDTMNARLKNSVDLLVFTRADEKKVGVRHVAIYRVQEPK